MASFYAGNIVGHTLGNRYRLLNLLGMGSSARVYLAEDVKLRRRVAVKLLHATLAGDESFLRRFQREAESLAPLTHQNIVVIHDVNDHQNENGEPPYLVTEYLSGGSLRNLLDGGSPLTPAQATLVGLGASRGLAFAHAHGVVHRDIKPANLLFGDDQRVRIGDFGLARALADYGRTEPAGALVGTAKYMSPEQAKGIAALDGRADVYSLALVLYEAVTGEVPFTADTWQGTAMARLHHDLSVPESFGPLGAVLEAAGTIDPERRLDAEGFALALEAAAKELPRPDPLILDGSRVLDRAAQLDERDPTLFALGTAPASLPVSDLTLHAPSTTLAAATAAGNLLVEQTPAPVLLTGPSAGSFPSTTPTSTNDDIGGSGRPGGLSDAPGVPAIIDLRRDSDADPATTKRTAKVPDAPKTSNDAKTPKTQKPPKAQKTPRTKRSSSSPERDRNDGGPVVDRVVDRKTERRNRRNRKLLAGLLAVLLAGGIGIGLAIARQTPKHIIPNLTGLTLAVGQGEVADAHFVLRPLEPEFSDTVPEGGIIRQSPAAGQSLKEDQEITVVISKGVKPVDVPDLGGRTVDAAVALLESVGLRSSNPPTFRPDDAIESGRVIEWAPKGSIAPNSLITLVVSSGPAEVAMPKVRGLRPAAAVAALPSGIESTIIEIFADTKAGLVTGSEPKAGSMVKRGDTVKIFVSKGPDLVKVPNVINLAPADAAATLRAAGFAIGNTIGPADQPVLHTRPLRNTMARRGTKITLYTTEDNVPEVPGVAATRSTKSTTTVLARQLPASTVKPTTTEPSA
jgi:eukaryotic-like serine/threonine-protein kinase